MNKSGDILLKIERVVKELSDYLDKDAINDQNKEKEISEANDAYSERIAFLNQELANKFQQAEIDRNSEISRANSDFSIASQDLSNYLERLKEVESEILESLVKRYGKKRRKDIQPEKVVIGELRVLLEKIKDDDFGAKMSRTFKAGGYDHLGNMVGEFLSKIDSAKLYVNTNDENNRNTRDLREQQAFEAERRVKATAQNDYDANKGVAEKQLNDRLYQIENAHKILDQELEKSVSAFLASGELEQLNSLSVVAAKEAGVSYSDWENYVPASTFPENFLLGIAGLDLSVPSALDYQLRAKMPDVFSSNNFKFPFFSSSDKPIKLFIKYNANSKEIAMSGVQAILLKYLRHLPTHSFDILFVDPNDRGSNLGILNHQFNNVINIKCCNAKDEIQNSFRDLERYIDTTSATLGSCSSVFEYNKTEKSNLKYKLIVLNDFPDNIEQNSMEALSVIIKNADKCGISIIFTSSKSWSSVGISIPKDYCVVDTTQSKCTLTIQSKTYAFEFDKLPQTAALYLSQIRSSYSSGLKVDNNFSTYFDLSRDFEIRNTLSEFKIPFAINSRREIVEIDLWGNHVLLSGRTKSGKSATLHMIISSIIMNYSPDDVELWLVDYNKVEFAEYSKNLPPHVRFLGLEDSQEFTFSLLDKLKDEFENRMNLFTQKGYHNIDEYKEKEGTNSITRIVLIVDEFHKMTQSVAADSNYKIVLENALSEYRKFGLSCIFSDQAITDGLRGLSDKGKNQIVVRMAMENVTSEIKATLDLSNQVYSDSLTARVNTMVSGDVIFKRVIVREDGVSDILLDIYKAIYIHSDERILICEKAKQKFTGNYKCFIIDAIGRKERDPDVIDSFCLQNALEDEKHYPMFIGTPANFNPCFYFELEPRLDTNIMIIGSSEDMRASIILNLCISFLRRNDSSVIVFANEDDDIYINYSKRLSDLGERVTLYSDIDSICRKIDEIHTISLTSKKIDPVLLIWLGLESMSEDFRLLPTKKEVLPSKETPVKNDSYIGTVVNNIEDALAKYEDDEDEEEPKEEHLVNSCAYNATDDVKDILARSPRNRIFSVVEFASVRLFRQAKFVKLDNFEHRVALKMTSSDSIDYLGKGGYASEIEDSTAVYNDGSPTVRSFRPYLL